MWSEFEREVCKCPHVTLASLKVMTSDVMTDLYREVIIHACKKFWSWIEAVMEATGVFLFNKYVCYMHITSNIILIIYVLRFLVLYSCCAGAKISYLLNLSKLCTTH